MIFLQLLLYNGFLLKYTINIKICFSNSEMWREAHMVDFYELRQLVAFADLGTLSRVAEEFHISTPSITRSMQHLETYFGVPLFIRSKNRIELNDTGRLAVDCARKLVQSAEQAVQQVRAFDQRQKTVVVRSCAPAPLWELLQKLNAAQPEKMVTSAVCRNEEVLDAWLEGACDIAILPFSIGNAKPFMRERLFVSVVPEHELARHSMLTFADINGYNFLLRSELGFWDTLCRTKMPASKFLVQTDASVFDELVNASSLPCFTTDYGQLRFSYPGRVNIPLMDEESDVTFYILRRGDINAKA